MAASGEVEHGTKSLMKRKRKKTFLQNARGFGKKGKLGHGSQLDQDTYDYFIRVLELLRGEFDSPQDKEALVINALHQTEENEINQSSNQVGARVLEDLIKLAPPEPLSRFMNVFSKNMRVVATNRFASHVLEALLTTATKHGIDATKAVAEETEHTTQEKKEANKVASHFGTECFEWVLSTSKFMLNNLEEFVWDEYANYIIRTVLACLAGCPPHDRDSNWSAKKNSPQPPPVFTPKPPGKVDEEAAPEPTTSQHIPGEFSEVLKEFCERITSWPQFSDLAYSNATSALLQALLSALSSSHSKLKKKLIKQLVDTTFSRPTTDPQDDSKEDKEADKPLQVAPVFTTDASVRLLEAVLEHSSSKHVTQIYALCFMGNLVTLSCDQATNFAVQRFLASHLNKEEFETVFDELAPGLDRVIENGRSGVVLALCQACKRLSTKQGPFVQHLMSALHCWDQAERRPLLVPLTVRLCNFEQFQTLQNTAPTQVDVAKDGVAKSRFHLHGSLIVQTMLSFAKPIKIVNSLLEMPGSDLKNLFCDTKGSHIMDAYAKGEFIGEKSREKLYYRLQGSYVAMACSKHGSRALEALYAVANPKNQIKIMEELAAREALVNGTDSGRIIANKWSLDLFRHRRNDWKQLQTRTERTKEMFADIIAKPST